nr:PREDICTED: uncharacterized protein LOC103357943 [Stegastes partitus]
MTESSGRNNSGLDIPASEVIFHSESSEEGSGHGADTAAAQGLVNKTITPEEPERASSENPSGSGITLTTRPGPTLHHSGAHEQGADKANSSITGYSHSSVHRLSEEALLDDGHITNEEQLKKSPRVNDDSLSGGDSPKLPVQTSVFTYMPNDNVPGPGGPCVLGVRPCVVLKNFNGTSLLWDDMRRTLAFAWELHVFGSASLFTLMALLAVLGMAGACTLPHPLCDALTLTLSLGWGLPFCLGILIKSLSPLPPFLRSSIPQWFPSQKTERRGKRLTAVCAFLAVLCCSLQMYSLFWLYGLLGNWRRFGWGWWLSQFWARILEIAWGFSLLVLGSWIFWTPFRGHSRGDHGQGRSEVSKRVEKKSLWGRLLASVRKGPLRKSEKTWEDLIPNNWAKYNLSRSGISNNAMCPYDDPPTAVIAEYKPDPLSSSSSDTQAALLWQKVGERECILSLIEFDMRPPSPINLRRSIDNALHHGQLVAGGLFTPPPPSWTHSMSTDSNDADSGTTTFPPAYVSYGWMLDTESISASLDHFQAKEPAQSPSATADYNGSIGSPAAARHEEEFSAVMHQHDWSEDDVTDL